MLPKNSCVKVLRYVMLIKACRKLIFVKKSKIEFLVFLKSPFNSLQNDM